MGYRMAGTYTAACDCRLVCPCPVDGTPTGPNDQCLGLAIFRIREGSLDDTDLGGVDFALYNHFPANITSGNWKVAIVVDEGASDAQAQAIERIVSGQEGGPFGEFVPLIGEYLGMDRAAISYDDDSGSGSVAGKSEFTFEPFTGPDGSKTTVRGAMFAFAPEYALGKTTTKSDAFGLSFSTDGAYGEHAEFEYSSEAAGEVHLRG